MLVSGGLRGGGGRGDGGRIHGGRGDGSRGGLMAGGFLGRHYARMTAKGQGKGGIGGSSAV